MKRRAVLANLGVNLGVPISGCSGLFENDIDRASTIDPVQRWDFEIEAVGARGRVDQPPEITCFPRANRVRISGVMYQGRSCDTVAVESMSMQSGNFSVVVAQFRQGTCGDELLTATYSAEFIFRESLPQEVTVIESMDQFGDQEAVVDCRGSS